MHYHSWCTRLWMKMLGQGAVSINAPSRLKKTHVISGGMNRNTGGRTRATYGFQVLLASRAHECIVFSPGCHSLSGTWTKLSPARKMRAQSGRSRTTSATSGETTEDMLIRTLPSIAGGGRTTCDLQTQATLRRIWDSFSSVQWLSYVDSLRPHGLQHAKPPCPSPTPEACSNSCPLSQWCHPTISSSVVPFSSCLQSFPASRSFQKSQFFTSGGQSIGASASASVLPINIQDWFPLGRTSLLSLQSKGLSRVFSNITVQKHQFFGTQLSLWSNSHIHAWLLEKL